MINAGSDKNTVRTDSAKGNKSKDVTTQVDKAPDVSKIDELRVLQAQYDSLEQRYSALFHLNQLSQECEELKSFYPQVHQSIASLMTAVNFFIVSYDQTFSTMEFVYYVDEKEPKLEGTLDYCDFSGSLIYRVIESMQPLLVTPSEDKKLEEYDQRIPGSTKESDWLGVPLIHNDLVIGMMAVQCYSDISHYTEQDLNMLTFAAQHVVGAIIRLQDKERLTSAVRARTQELMKQIRERDKSELLQESLYRISELSNDVSFDINVFYSKVHNIIGQLIHATNFFIAKYDKESDTIDYVYVVDEESKQPDGFFLKRELSALYSKLVIRQKKAILLTKQEMIALFEEGHTREPNEGEHSWLGVPLIYSGELLGVMVLQSYSSRKTYTQQDSELLNFVSNHISAAIKRREAADTERESHERLEQQVKLRTLALEEEIAQRKEAEKRLKHTASHDSLTGLPNRSVFIDLLNHAIACNQRKPDLEFAILFLDLDRFKVVNDSLGHHAGDTLLKLIARELSTIIRGKDTVARLGGDEFVILIEDLESNKEAFNIAQRITDFIQQPFTIDNQLVFTGTSIGILFSDVRYKNADTMLRDADTAMYHAKDNGKGRYEVFDASMHQRVQNSLSLEADIREAIEWQEFIPYFQPIIKLDSDELKGFEALARWQSTKRGFVYPNDFIPLAEETNLVQAIDLQIVKKACHQLKIWQDKLLRHDLYVSCNLFCSQFFNASLPDDIEQILVETGLKPEHLRVELTERALLENTDIVLTNMKALKNIGVKILLDDFGTGYSSLSYLHRFPIDVLKIDRSFITNVHEHENNKAIIKTIIDLASNLNMATVGEGVESIEDALLLKKMDCLYGQGYFYAKPMASDEMEQYIVTNTKISP